MQSTTVESAIRISRYTAPEGGEWIQVAPEGFLGVARYNTFKEVCARAELVFNRRAQANLAPIQRAARALGLLRAADFALVSDTPEILTGYERNLDGLELYIAELPDQLWARVNPILRVQKGGEILDFQRQDIRRMLRSPIGINANPMGLGKTLESLLAIYPPEAPVLVICPANAKGVWRDEAQTLELGRDIVTLRGNNSWQWPVPGQIVISGCSTLPARIPEGCCPGTNLFIDEFHYCKNPKAARSQRVRQVIDMIMDQLGRIWGLTGTPMDTGIDLWELTKLLGLEDRAYGSVPGCSNPWGGFLKLFGGKQVKRYIPAMTCKNGRKIPPRKLNQWEFKPSRVQPESTHRLARIMIRHSKEDVLPQLPAKRYQLVPVALSDLLKGKQLKEAQQALDGTWKLVENASDQEMFELLSQGSPQFNQYSAVAKMLATAKIDFVHELLDEMEEQGEPVVVFSQHLEPVLQLGAREGWAMIHGAIEDRFEIAQRFQRGELRGIALTIGAGKESLTLTRAREMIFVDRYWRAMDNSQAEDRIHRLGQQWPIRIRDIEVDHPLERRRRAILLAKQQMATRTIDAMARQTLPTLTWEMIR